MKHSQIETAIPIPVLCGPDDACLSSYMACGIYGIVCLLSLAVSSQHLLQAVVKEHWCTHTSRRTCPYMSPMGCEGALPAAL